jgi:hypothetical protein
VVQPTDPDRSLEAIARGYHTCAVPSNPALDGLRFFIQGAVLAPGYNAAGAVLSDSAQGIAGAL